LRAYAALAGLQARTLRRSALEGRLHAVRHGRAWFTTRRHLHAYLMGRRRGVVKPLPDGYEATDGEIFR
jgi:hypothetical protein